MRLQVYTMTIKMLFVLPSMVFRYLHLPRKSSSFACTRTGKTEQHRQPAQTKIKMQLSQQQLDVELV